MYVKPVPYSPLVDGRTSIPAKSQSISQGVREEDKTDGACSLTYTGIDLSPTTQPSRFLARQPILDVQRDVIGYELLFRYGWENCFHGDRDEAIRQTLDNYLYMDIESLSKDRLAFVNCTHQAIVDKLVTLLPPQTAVLEILETVAPDAELVRACIDLLDIGYKLALDDFVPRPELQPLVEIASYIKVDLRISDAATRRQIRGVMRNSHAALLAEKVEDQNDFDIARGEGYEYFQGYFFARPRITANRVIPPNKTNYLRLLVELTRNPFHLSEVARIVELEPSLCYRLLRLANSALWGVRNNVTGVRDAIVLVGEDRFRILVSVAASCVLGQNQRCALVGLSLERARFCELVAPFVGENPTEQFMLGLLSLVDAMLETSMDSIAKSLPLREAAKVALLGGTNSASVPLDLGRSFESTGRATSARTAGAPTIGEETLAGLYMESVKWAAAMTSVA